MDRNLLSKTFAWATYSLYREHYVEISVIASAILQGFTTETIICHDILYVANTSIFSSKLCNYVVSILRVINLSVFGAFNYWTEKYLNSL